MERMYRILIVILCLFGVAPGAVAGDIPSAGSAAVSNGSFAIDSTAFAPGGTIPAVHTCSGKDISPPLNWSHIPAGTKSLALIVDDPDAPAGDFVHWVIFNLPADGTGLPEGISHGALPSGAVEGKNGFGRSGYGGPCPPAGKPHRYVFTLYAVDTRLLLPAGTVKDRLMAAMAGHLIARTELTGKFGRPR